MSRLRRSLGVLALAATAAASATGCEDNESMLFIVGVLSTDRTQCVARPEADATLLSGGVLDLQLRSTYRAALLVGSQLTQRGSRDQLRTETARFSLQGAEVTLTDFRGELLAIGNNPYTAIGTGFVNPSGGEEAGYGAMFVDLVPPNLPVRDQTIVARIRVFGTTLGGAELESNEYIFPLAICRGCLIGYSAVSKDVGQEAYRCRTVTSEPIQLEACFPGQDTPVPCDYCSGSNDACLDPCNNCSAVAGGFGPCATMPEGCDPTMMMP